MTCRAILAALPFTVSAVQARVAGEELWVQEGPALAVPQENATVNLQVGEIGYAPMTARSDIGNSVAIVYGDAKLADCVNVFAHVFAEDELFLKKLGERVWLEGKTKLRFTGRKG